MSENEKFDTWALVEIFGHQKIARRVTEQVIAGQGFIRVDVPETKRQPAFTRLFGPSSIYAITPVAEDLARRAAESILVEPIVVYIAPSRQLEDGFDEDD